MILNILINTKCNKNCEYCFLDKDGLTYNYNDNFYNKIKLSKDYIKNINVLGGEPTLHPNIGNILNKLKTISPNINVMTNLSTNVNFDTTNIRFGVSFSHINNDNDYDEVRNNLLKLNIDNVGIAFVLSNIKHKMSLHIKYLTQFYKEFNTTKLTDLCVYLPHPNENFISSNDKFDEYINTSSNYITDLINIIKIRNKYNKDSPLVLGCGGLYRCMFQSQEDIEFIKYNVKKFKYGCKFNKDMPFTIQGENSYSCIPLKKFKTIKFKDIKSSYDELTYENISIPNRCINCKYLNNECFGPCMGFYS